MSSLYRVGNGSWDIASTYRARDTAYLAEVEATVYWISEPSHPRLAYPADFDRNQTSASTYRYTLEFDAQRRLIGGEWGTFDAIDPTDEVPDFVFGYDKEQKPADLLGNNAKEFSAASIDYSGIIEKLHDCSLDAKTDGQQQVLGQNLPYKTCVIDKVTTP